MHFFFAAQISNDLEALRPSQEPQQLRAANRSTNERVNHHLFYPVFLCWMVVKHAVVVHRGLNATHMSGFNCLSSWFFLCCFQTHHKSSSSGMNLVDYTRM